MLLLLAPAPCSCSLLLGLCSCSLFMLIAHAHCSLLMLIALYSLLFSHCPLLFAHCSLLIAHCSLLLALAPCSPQFVPAPCPLLLLLALCSFLSKYLGNRTWSVGAEKSARFVPAKTTYIQKQAFNKATYDQAP